MNKLLPILLATAIAISSAYLTPLYPVYAQSTSDTFPQGAALQRPSKTATSPGALKARGVVTDVMERIELKNSTRSAALKQKIARFKDKNKAARLELINTNLNDINSRKTQNMQETLDKISALLERLKNKASTVSSGELDSAIAEVESQWSEASAAVEAQSAKDYSINLNTETTAASDATAAKNLLQSDLMATHGQILDVRQALTNAIQSAISEFKGGNNGTN